MNNMKLKQRTQEVFNLASVDAVEHMNNTLHLESIVYYCFYVCKNFISSEDAEKEGAGIVYKMFNELDKSGKSNLLEDLRGIVDDLLTDNSVPKELIVNNKITLGVDIIEMIDLIKGIKSKDIFYSSINNSDNDDGISIDDIIYGSLTFKGAGDEDSDLIVKLKDNNITLGSFIGNVVSDLFSDSPLGAIINPKNSKDDYNSKDFEKAGELSEIRLKKSDPNSPTPTLDEFGINMTEEAKKGKFDLVIGREKEIDQIIEILCCRKKNNAMVIGKAGTGKTALVECLAQKIASGEVPEELKEKRIISLSTTTLTAGTIYRGQLEQRVQEICNEVAKSKDVIIFIDEFHSAVSESSSDISQMLKPSLSRGELTLIAGTTYEEYKKYVEKDSALKRRFQKVFINEPSQEETLLILKGLKDKYSNFHGVEYPDEVLEMCVRLSKRYLYDRNAPDRAIDLMDVSGSHAKLCHPVDTSKITSMKKKIEKTKLAKSSAVKKEDYEKAVVERNKQKELEEKLNDTIEEMHKNNKVTETDVATVVSELVNIPIDKILNPDIKKLSKMGPELKSIIIGQDESIDLVTNLLSRQFLGLRDENIPPSLYISGGTGTGKTYLAEEIAKTVFGTQDAMLRIDCGELTQPHTVTKLIGAPPSYVGFGEVALFDKVRERPQQLILVDEADKLCDEILNTIFLNILTTGSITLSNGIEVSFKDCIFIFTSNDGTKELEAHGSGIGFGMEDKKAITKDIVMKAIKKRIRPEVINRFSGIVIFNPLGIPEMEKIYELELNKVKNRLQRKGLILTVKDEVRDKIISELDLRYGARDLTREISRWVEDPICDKIINNPDDISKKKKIEIGLDKTGSEVNVKLKK